MAVRKNAFTSDFLSLLDALGDLHFASFTADQMLSQSLKHHRKSIEEKVQTAGAKRPRMHSMTTRLVVPDYVRSEEWMVNFSTKERHAIDSRLYDLVEEAARRLQGEMFCGAFEMMEVFLKRISAKYYYHARTERFAEIRPSFRRSEFAKRHAGAKLSVNTPAYFEAYVRFATRSGCDVMLSEFGNKLPFFRDSRLMASRLAQLIEHYRSIEFCRHKITHESGRYNESEIRRFPRFQQEMIRNITEKSLLLDEDIILPTQKAVTDACNDLAGIALFVIEALTRAFDMGRDFESAFNRDRS